MPRVIFSVPHLARSYEVTDENVIPMVRNLIHEAAAGGYPLSVVVKSAESPIIRRREALARQNYKAGPEHHLVLNSENRVEEILTVIRSLLTQSERIGQPITWSIAYPYPMDGGGQWKIEISGAPRK
jgi:hypothetical protein